MLTRAVGAWLFVGLPVIAARIWWSVAAAVTVFVVTVTMYVAAAVRYMHRHRRQPWLQSTGPKPVSSTPADATIPIGPHPRFSYRVGSKRP